MTDAPDERDAPADDPARADPARDATAADPAPSDLAGGWDGFLEIVRRRRSVRRFEPGRAVDRAVLLDIAEAARWAPTGANTQCWDLIVIDDPAMRDRVLEVFLRQSERLIRHVRGFPAVKKTYLANTVAIFIVLGDPRFKASFPQATDLTWKDEFDANNERIYLASLGAVIQNLQLAVTARGLTSAWLSGGGEDTTNEELRAVLGFPRPLRAIGTIPVGYPEKGVTRRWRRPLDQVVHWNGYEASRHRPAEMVQYYVDHLRPFAMYRTVETMTEWDDHQEKLGPWLEAFTSATIRDPGAPED